MQHIAVVGASSQIGKALLPMLTERGIQVSSITRKHVNSDTTNSFRFDSQKIGFHPCLRDVDAIITLAPLPTIDMVLQMAELLEVRRILAFGSTGRFSKENSSSSLEKNFVKQQKDAEERLATGCEKIGVAWTLFRPTMIYGAGKDQSISFIQSMIRRFGFFLLPTNACGLRQPVHVGDLACACVKALDCEKTMNVAYNLGGGETITFSDLVVRIFEHEGIRPKLVKIPMWLYHAVISLFKWFPMASFLRYEMVERMSVDLTVDNTAAFVDFGYKPKLFDLNIDATVNGPNM